MGSNPTLGPINMKKNIVSTTLAIIAGILAWHNPNPEIWGWFLFGSVITHEFSDSNEEKEENE